MTLLSPQKLSSTFREIYSANNQNSAGSLPLTPNPSGTALYDSRFGKGRLYNFLVPNKIKQKLQDRAWTNIVSSSREQLMQCGKQLADYKKGFFEQLLEGKPASKEFEEARWNLCNFDARFGQFYQTVLNSNEHNLISQECTKRFLVPTLLQKEPAKNTALQLWFKKDNKQAAKKEDQALVLNQEAIQSYEPHATEKLIREIDQYVSLIRIGISEIPIILAKMARDKELTKEETKAMELWKTYLKKDANQHSVNALYTALDALSNILANAFPEENILSTFEIEWKLYQTGLKEFFEKDDPQFLAWRNTQVYVGATITCNDEPKLLIDQLDWRPVPDRNQYFRIAGAPNKLLWIANNKIILPLEANRRKMEGFGIEGAEIIEIDSEGKCAIIECLESKLLSFNWKSNSKRIAKCDRDILYPVIELIKWWKSEERLPHPLRAQDYYFNAEGILKTIRPVSEGPFNIISLTKYIKKVSQGNLHIYHYIVDKADLKRHPYGILYRKIVERISKGKDPEVENLAGVRQIKSQIAVDQGKKLALKAQSILEKCRKKLEKHHVASATDFEQRLGNALLKCYDDGEMIASLPKSAKQDILNYMDMHSKKMIITI